MVTLVTRAFLFVDEGEHLVFVLVYKANLECQEIWASDWLEPPISTLLSYSLWVYVLHAKFGFALQEVYLQFKHR